VAIAIAIHNIPEGVAISIPVYYATGSRRKAFAYSLLSGLTEPVGALIGYLLIFSFSPNVLCGVALASAAGIMVFIALDELLPCAIRCGEPHLSLYGLIAGMGLMAVFGIGTVPSLLMVARLSGMGWLKSRDIIYKIGAIMMIGVGIYFLIKGFRY